MSRKECQIEQFAHAVFPSSFAELVRGLAANQLTSRSQMLSTDVRESQVRAPLFAGLELAFRSSSSRDSHGRRPRIADRTYIWADVQAEDIGGLRLLERRLGRDFAAGLVLCTAPEPRQLGGWL